MIFNSIEFLIFFPIVFVLYWFVFNKNVKVQNFLLLIASYFFYGWWDERFLILIVFSSLVDFSIGKRIVKASGSKEKKMLLVASLIVNLCLLIYFKYHNFFVDNFIEAFHFFGYQFNKPTLNIVLPVGISFYTFQTLSYTIDVYRGDIKAEKNIISFFTYVSFFPQLVAGPIERATNLLPQFSRKRLFQYVAARDGCRQILWGLFKKIVIADNCAKYVNIIFDSPETNSGSTLILGAVLFALQIYGDFSGYSDIAIGSSRLLGFNLRQNFAFPYFSRDIAEFWRRWHISLSNWFRDYLYIPLGGSRGTLITKIRNTLIIFVVSGFWHGPNWTFVVWGGLNALYFIPYLISNRNRKNLEYAKIVGLHDGVSNLIKVLGTFSLTCFAWIFFRAESMGAAWIYIKNIFSVRIFHFPYITEPITNLPIFPFKLLVIIFGAILIEWFGRHWKHPLENLDLKFNVVLRSIIYYILIVLIFTFGGEPQEFIYFQF